MDRIVAVLSLLAGNFVAAPVATAQAGGDFAAPSGCALQNQAGVESGSTSCVSCHSAGSGSGHPVDIDYASFVFSRGGGMGLRPVEEVVKRGVFLPEGRIQCLTCHDPQSRLRFNLALPPGAKLVPSVNPRDPKTYEEGPLLNARKAALAAEVAAGKRPDVSPKPLCLACHAAD